MIRYLKSAAYLQLVSESSLPGTIESRVSQLAQNGEVNQIKFFLQDQSIAEVNNRTLKVRLCDVLSRMKQLDKNLEHPNDANTFLLNFEKLTGKPFQKPAWLSSEMRKIDV